MRHQLTCLILFVLLSLAGRASHIVGGDIHYEYLGNNQYRITLKVYRDCATSSTNFDDPASIGIYNSAGDLVENIEIPLADALVSDVPINDLDPCLQAPTGICVKEAIYSATVSLPMIPGGYTISYQRCCRNSTLVNTTSNDDLGITLTTQIPGTELTNVNSNPAFNEFPPIVICMNQPFEFDHSATDIDGDQLVYEFCNPLLSNVPGFYINPPGPPPYPNLIFDPGYSAAYPISSSPAFAIDATTGLITGTPNLLGQFVVGVCVKEYRDGVLLSTTNRDFQFNITLCGLNISSAFVEPQPCTGLEAHFANESTGDANWVWDFGVEGTDTDISTEESPIYLYPDTGWYEVTLIINNGTLCADTSVAMFHALPDLNPVISDSTFACFNGARYYDFEVTGNLTSDAIINWQFGAQATPSTGNGFAPQNIMYVSPFGNQTVVVTTADMGCLETDTLLLPLPPNPIPIITPQEAFCNGFEYTMGNESLHANGYQWSFNVPIAGVAVNDFEPVVTFPGPAQYIIGLTAFATNTCPQYTEQEFEIYPALQPEFDPGDAQCLLINDFTWVADGYSDTDASFLWEIEGQSIQSSAEVNDIHFNQPGWYTITLTIEENGCIRSFIDSVEVVLEPELFIALDTVKGCPPLVVDFVANSVSQYPVYYLWDFGNGQNSSLQNPVITYLNSGNFDVSVQAFTTSGCVTTINQVFEDIVQVYPVPTPGFEILPSEVTLDAAFSVIENRSPDNVSCFYEMGDGGTSDDCSFDYFWSETGRINVTQTVTNEYGCTAQAVGQVIVSGHSFYAPNSFTPNDDGINDGWKPIVAGISEYRVSLFNRWGEEIFVSTNPEEYWMGQHKQGHHYAQSDAYEYVVEIKDKLGNPYRYEGHVSLIR